VNCQLHWPYYERSQRDKRASRESKLWSKGVAALPADSQLVDVCDRGADNFEFLKLEVRSGRRFVIRSCHNRRIFLGQDSNDPARLHDHLGSLDAIGTWQLQVTSKIELRRGRGKQKKRRIKRQPRWANMAVSVAAVQIRSKTQCSEPLAMWAAGHDGPPGPRVANWLGSHAAAHSHTASGMPKRDLEVIAIDEIYVGRKDRTSPS
jgi:hypothetical protein